MKKVTFFTLAALTAIMIGCAMVPPDPLFDSPIGQRTTCQAVSPVKSDNALNTVPFNCPEMNLSATLNELRDAGWRVENLSLGEDIKVGDTLASDVEIAIRKIY